MKKMLLIMLLTGYIVSAQSADSLSVATADSIDIRALIQKEIDAIKERGGATSRTITIPAKEPVQPAKEKILIKIEDKIETNNAQVALPINVYNNMPIQYKLFGGVSLIIVFFVFFRRIVLNISKTSTKKLKEKIGLMRLEKVGGSKENPKMKKTRFHLKNSTELFVQSEANISKKARQLNISKGEVLLAARLKLLEVGKLTR